MSLAAGARLGGYEVLSHLGSGGMGEVYRARDTRLARDVAIKILPDGFAHDPERLARFKREAQVLASLNHPHIGAIYGLEESGPTQFLVLELVDGETLADRIAAQRAASRGLPTVEALALAAQIADALGAAHEKGIIHRDLKPANIALTENDQIKVLDFGLAKALDPVASGVGEGGVTHSPTLTLHATHAGVILGTAAYMSPEQAKGRVADKRSDVWAFGCVLFEMLAGTRPFEGEDVSDTLATILKGEPEWSRLPADTPASIRALLRHCLEKDRRQRIADIAVARYVLGAPLEAAAPARTPADAGKPRSSWIGFAAALAAALVAAAGGWILKPSPTASARPITRFPIILAQDQSFTSSGRHILALSPDGTRLVYVANSQLFLRAMDQVDASPIRGTNEGAAEPFFSPDGQWIAYYADGHLRKVAISGGAPTTLCDAQIPWGASWEGDRIVFGEGPQGIFEVAATGGTPKLLVAPDTKQSEFLHGPQILPGGQAVLFTSGSPGVVASRWSNATIVGAVAEDRRAQDPRARRYRWPLRAHRSSGVLARRRPVRQRVRRGAAGTQGRTSGGRRRCRGRQWRQHRRRAGGHLEHGHARLPARHGWSGDEAGVEEPARCGHTDSGAAALVRNAARVAGWHAHRDARDGSGQRHLGPGHEE